MPASRGFQHFFSSHPSAGSRPACLRRKCQRTFYLFASSCDQFRCYISYCKSLRVFVESLFITQGRIAFPVRVLNEHDAVRCRARGCSCAIVFLLVSHRFWPNTLLLNARYWLGESSSLLSRAKTGLFVSRGRVWRKLAVQQCRSVRRARIQLLTAMRQWNFVWAAKELNLLRLVKHQRSLCCLRRL